MFKFKIEPYIQKPVRNPFSSDQVVRTMPITLLQEYKPELCIAYYKGYIKACDWFLSWAKANKIKIGSIGDDDLGGLYAQIQYNRDESDCLCRELEREQKDK